MGTLGPELEQSFEADFQATCASAPDYDQDYELLLSPLQRLFFCPRTGRQQALAKQDAWGGLLVVLVTLMTAAWAWRLLASSQPATPDLARALLYATLYAAASAAPLVMTLARGAEWYSRRRRGVVVTLRLLHLALLVLLPLNLEALMAPGGGGFNSGSSSSGAASAAYTLARLMISCHPIDLLTSCLAFRLGLPATAALQAASALAAGAQALDACSLAHMRLPEARAALDSIIDFLNAGPTLTPISMPAVAELPPSADPCRLLVLWIEVCLLAVPCGLVVLWQARARQRFALGLPRGALPPPQRARWLALCLPAAGPALLLGALPLALALWRLMALGAELWLGAAPMV